jgi:phospholipid/cholesterol/gamma-HCH transport system permease protein
MAGQSSARPGSSPAAVTLSVSLESRAATASAPLNSGTWNPFRLAADVVGYLGRLAILATLSLGGIFRRRGEASFVAETTHQLDRLLGTGLPIVGLVHVGMGSFLSMQAYFGATFMDGIGPVTGVGLIRNLAPLLVGFLLAGIVSIRFVGEFRQLPDEAIGDPGSLVAPRILAAMIAGPVLSVWGSLVGIAIGWLVANSMMGLTLPAFFDMFLEMLWARDIAGLVLKGSIFGGIAGLLACQEGLTRRHGHEDHCDFETMVAAATRSACLAGVAILFVNSAWFLLLYHAGPPFGPTVLTPPRE